MSKQIVIAAVAVVVSVSAPVGFAGSGGSAGSVGGGHGGGATGSLSAGSGSHAGGGHGASHSQTGRTFSGPRIFRRGGGVYYGGDGGLIDDNGRYGPGSMDLDPEGMGRPMSPPPERPVVSTKTEFPYGMTVQRAPTILRRLQGQGLTFTAWNIRRQEALQADRSSHLAELDRFVLNRTSAWNSFQEHAKDHPDWALDHSAAWQGFRENLSRFRVNRAEEVRDRLRDRADALFTPDWWSAQGWGGARFARFTGFGGSDPWWWWNGCSWPDAAGFLDLGAEQPADYDYGASVVPNGDELYIDGQQAGSSSDYAREASDLARSSEVPDLPAPPDSAVAAPAWRPLGVYAFTQERSGDATMFFQLSVNPEGVISGGYVNVMTGESHPVAGAIDKVAQRAAWHIGNQDDATFEAGVYNLTQDVTPVLVHFGNGIDQTWLLVRLRAPELPRPATPVPVVAPAPSAVDDGRE